MNIGSAAGSGFADATARLSIAIHPWSSWNASVIVSLPVAVTRN